ncbi:MULTISPECIES: exonuclease domain-containing protein [unclassified Brevundimonas]|uniref:exonuclease domain-containing protein n=1 Tax=unclassified Brevundimonas TaxID=2622653 RepID=UPI0025BAFFD5|nr:MULTISPECIES: exonuclease domain-containing protein [unclassified Brevundimonas]
MRAVAIDFETANERRASACSIGLAWIEDGRVVDRETHLIRPPEMRFAPVNIRIHGITPDMVEDSPEFPDVLASLRERIGTCDMVLAHNAGFDMSVVRASCDAYSLSYPEFDYLCTVKVAQRVWAELGTARLNALGDHLGIAFKHHDAGEDAYVCAEVALAAMRLREATNLHELAKITQVGIGRMSSAGYSACSAPRQARARSIANAKPYSDVFRPVPGMPLSMQGKRVVFSGQLSRFSRSEAQEIAGRFGARVMASVNAKTDWVVVGNGAGSKLDRARHLGLKLLSEADFMDLITVKS